MLSKTRNVMRTRHGSKRRKIENKSRVTSDTKRYIDEDLVPRDLVIEILRRLPVKSVARFLLVSKLWATIIRSQDFIRSFPFNCSPGLLLAFKDLDKQKLRLIWNFYSSSSTSEPALEENKSYLTLAVPYLSHTTCSNVMSPKSRENDINEVPDYVNGLISLGCGGEQIICNPSIHKSITLPKVKTRKKVIRSFFGYDPIDGQYKVLCMSEKVYHYWDGPSYEHQVFTLGGVDKSWKMIECNILHRPKTNGVSINGVVYYGALTGSAMRETCLMRFDVRSEKFDQVVQFFGDHSPPPLTRSVYRLPYLISYKGKPTLTIQIEQTKFELWILEDAEKQGWSKVCFSIGHLLNYISSNHVRIRGDISGHTDDIVLVSWHPGRFIFLYYDHKQKIARKIFAIEENTSKNYSHAVIMVPFLNYVESVMLL